MKRFLNLNDFGDKAVKGIVVFGIGIPALLYVLSLVLNALHFQLPLLRRLTWGSLAVSGILLVGLLALVTVELIQDELLYRIYRKELGKRIRGAGITAECPYCGNRKIQEFERQCPVCGKKLD